MENIDIVCPVIEADLPKLKVCLPTWEKYVYPNINNIFTVGNDSDAIRIFAKDNSLTYVNENDYLQCDDSVLDPIREDRRGWIKQQLIKLQGTIGDNENTLVIDADVFFLRQHIFLDNNIPHFFMNGTFWDRARKTASELINMQPNTDLSYVTDKMIFNKNVLSELKEIIEYTTGKEWKEAIISTYDNTSLISFSEYELYGMFYNDKNVKELEHLARCKWNNERTYDNVRKRFFVFDQVTFE